MQVVVNWAKVLPLCGQNLWYRTLVVRKVHLTFFTRRSLPHRCNAQADSQRAEDVAEDWSRKLWEDLFVNYWYRFPVLYVFARLAPAHKMGKMG